MTHWQNKYLAHMIHKYWLKPGYNRCLWKVVSCWQEGP